MAEHPFWFTAISSGSEPHPLVADLKVVATKGRFSIALYTYDGSLYGEGCYRAVPACALCVEEPAICNADQL